MKTHMSFKVVIRTLLPLAVAVVAGSSCQRARHAEVTQAHVVSGEIVHGIEKSAREPVSPTDLARHELQKGNTVANTGAANATAEQVHATERQAKPKPVGPMCYVESFHHKAGTDDTDEETSSHHKNLMVLAHANINPKHICVRVNGIPVKFTHEASRKGDQILIGAIAGPTAKITVSYCVGKLVCPEVSQKDCTIPRDAFMDALGGSDDSDDGAAAKDVVWQSADNVQNAAQNAKDAKLNTDVNKELSKLGGMGEDSARGPASMPVFNGWIEEQDSPACPAQAS